MHRVRDDWFLSAVSGGPSVTRPAYYYREIYEYLLKEPPSNEVHRDYSASFLWQALESIRSDYN